MSDCEHIRFGGDAITGDMTCLGCGKWVTEILDNKNKKIEDLEAKLNDCDELTKIQQGDGNWDQDEYMRGMANGMEVLMATLQDREPIFKKAPEGSEIPTTKNYECMGERMKTTITETYEEEDE